VISIILIVAYFVFGFLMYDKLPDQVPTHWGIDGTADGWSSKLAATLLLPLITICIYTILTFLPLIDPLKRNIFVAAREYFIFKLALVVFFGLIYFMMLANAALGEIIPVTQGLFVGLALVFMAVAQVLPRVKRNYTVGIRLPWTLESDVVWKKTHIFGEKAFMVLGAVCAFLSFLPPWLAFVIFFISLFVIVLALVGYAYSTYHVMQRRRA